MYRTVGRVSVAQDRTLATPSGTLSVAASDLRYRAPSAGGNLPGARAFDKLPLLSTDIFSTDINQAVSQEPGSTSSTDARLNRLFF